MQGHNWNDLKVVLAVWRTGRLARAGQVLGANETTVARRLRAVEAALGLSLFLRDGAGRLEPTEAGRAHFPASLVVSQSHYHEFQIPETAQHLARSEMYENQAFSYGDKVFGFQFHPEVTRRGFRRWQDHDTAPYDKPGVQTRDEQDRLSEEHDPAQAAWFRAFLDELFGPPSEYTPHRHGSVKRG